MDHLRRQIKAFIEIFENVAQHNKLCFCGMMAAELEQLDHSNRILLANYFLETEQWLIRLFDEHRGELHTELSSTVLARSMLAGLEGALLVDCVDNGKHRVKALKELYMSFLV